MPCLCKGKALRPASEGEPYTAKPKPKGEEYDRRELQLAAWWRFEAPLINRRKMVGILSKSADLSKK